MFSDLSLPQSLYLVAVGCNGFFLLLFLRLFWFKHYAEKHFWHKRPDLAIESMREIAMEKGESLPRFSMLVPARNEADVIERTIEHMAALEYPPEQYELVVVTDEKEVLAADRDRQEAVSDAVIAMRRGEVPAAHDAKPGALIVALLGTLALDGLDEVQLRLGRSEGAHLLRRIPTPLLRPLIWETSSRMLNPRQVRGTAPFMLRMLRRRLPDATEDQLQGAYAAMVALSIPTAVAYRGATGGDGSALGRKLAAIAAEAHHSLTREIIHAMCEALALDLLNKLEPCRSDVNLESRFAEIYREIFPTTQDIMERKVAEFALRDGAPTLKHVVVPHDFDGNLGGGCLGTAVPSTKGRALNWALGFIDERSRWCAFYDAESRPDRRSLLYVAHRTVAAMNGGKPVPRIFQGPVFQVRNWYEMSPFCKIASLYQSIAHDWYMPFLFKRLPFVGGTNLFVEAKLLKEIGGYDPTTLTEDLELGTRAYLKAGAWPEYLPYPSSEQTPPTFAGFFRQRLRWAAGHLQVMARIRSWDDCDVVRRKKLLWQLWRKGQGEWMFYQSATFIPPTLIVLWWLDLVDPSVVAPGWRLAMHGLSGLYVIFTVYCFYRYLDHVDEASRPRRLSGQLGAFAHLLLLPVASFLLPVPYSSALLLAALGKGPSGWVKTPRTRE